MDGSLPKVTGVRAGQGEACPGALFQFCFPHKESEQPSPGSPVGPELQGPGAPHQASACFQNEEQAVFRKGPASLLDPSGRSHLQLLLSKWLLAISWGSKVEATAGM